MERPNARPANARNDRVGWTGLYYEWTTNHVALGIVMVFSAWLFTKTVSALIWIAKQLFKRSVLR